MNQLIEWWRAPLTDDLSIYILGGLSLVCILAVSIYLAVWGLNGINRIGK
jgi:hypothetical protein